MSNKKTTATVKANVSNATKETVNKLNLSMFTDKLKNVELTEKKERDVIYIYPETMKTEKERNSKEGKKFRSGLRRSLERHCTNILIHTKYDRQEDLKKEIELFLAFYKKNYKNNDFSIKSVSQSNKEEKADQLKMMFEIINAVSKK